MLTCWRPGWSSGWPCSRVSSTGRPARPSPWRARRRPFYVSVAGEVVGHPRRRGDPAARPGGLVRRARPAPGGRASDRQRDHPRPGRPADRGPADVPDGSGRAPRGPRRSPPSTPAITTADLRGLRPRARRPRPRTPYCSATTITMRLFRVVLDPPTAGGQRERRGDVVHDVRPVWTWPTRRPRTARPLPSPARTGRTRSPRCRHPGVAVQKSRTAIAPASGVVVVPDQRHHLGAALCARMWARTRLGRPAGLSHGHQPDAGVGSDLRDPRRHRRHQVVVGMRGNTCSANVRS